MRATVLNLLRCGVNQPHYAPIDNLQGTATGLPEWAVRRPHKTKGLINVQRPY